MNDEFIYLDHSATTPTDPRVVEAMLPHWTNNFGNASSLHRVGKSAEAALTHARETVAQVLNCYPAGPAEIIFTSGGTESNNLALRGVSAAMAARGRGRHIITTAVEHHATLDVAKELADNGYEVTFLPVDEYGRVTAQQVVEVLVDAVQAAGLLPLDVKALNVDLLSLSAHKFYGPKGIGLLYVRRAVPLKPQMVGGGQQAHRRAGTEPVPMIVGLAEALHLAESERAETIAKLIPLRDELIHQILELIPEAALTGHPTERLAGHSSFAMQGLNGDSLLLDLNEIGIGASGGSACTTGQQEPSHVLLAMGVDPDRLMGQMRFVLGKHSTREHVEKLVYHLKALVERHRAMVPEVK
jgi:cysteine desulfurase